MHKAYAYNQLFTYLIFAQLKLVLFIPIYS